MCKSKAGLMADGLCADCHSLVRYPATLPLAGQRRAASIREAIAAIEDDYDGRLPEWAERC